jgi:thymidylate synthase
MAVDETYCNLIERVLTEGEARADRTGVGTKSLFGVHVEVSPDVVRDFPLVSVKHTNFRSVVLELLWFLRGDTNIKSLGCGIWDEWADEEGDLGPVYGAQWRAWGMKHDQISELVNALQFDPTSRRHVVSAWNVGALDCMALPPCHLLFQCHVSVDGLLSMQVYQRSADLGLGVPFNWASYALLLRMLAKETGLHAHRLCFAYGDLHVYDNHAEPLREMIAQAKDRQYPAPRVFLAQQKVMPLWTGNRSRWYGAEDVVLENYRPGPRIKLEVAV